MENKQETEQSLVAWEPKSIPHISVLKPRTGKKIEKKKQVTTLSRVYRGVDLVSRRPDVGAESAPLTSSLAATMH